MHNMLCPPFIFTLGLDDFSKTFLGNNFPLYLLFFLTRAPLLILCSSRRPIGKKCFSNSNLNLAMKVALQEIWARNKKKCLQLTQHLCLPFFVWSASWLSLNKSFPLPQSVWKSTKMSHLSTFFFRNFKNSHFFLRSKLAFRYGKVHIFQKTFFEGFFFKHSGWNLISIEKM